MLHLIEKTVRTVALPLAIVFATFAQAQTN